MLPVNLAGVLKSVQQALSGKKIPFARTPKVKNRTVSPLLYVVAPMLIIGFSMFTLVRDVDAQNWANAAFAGFNAFVAAWAVKSYIGIRNSLIDIWVGLTDWMYDDVKSKPAVAVENDQPEIDWRAILYHGDAKGTVPLIERSATAVKYEESKLAI